MKKRLALALLAGLVASTASADPLLFVAPLRVEIAPGASTAVVTLTNKSNKTQRYVGTFSDQIMNTEGAIETVEDFPYSSKRMLRLMPRRIVLGPGERQMVRVLARRPADLVDGDYHTHLIFDEEQPSQLAKVASATTPQGEKAPSKGVKFGMGAVYSIGIPVLVQQGDISATARMTDATYAPATATSQPALKFAFQRSGNAEAGGYLTAMVNGKDAITPRNVRVYREINNVVLTLPLLEAAKGYHGPISVRYAVSDDPSATALNETTVTIP